jgi:glycogen synthase
LSADVEDGGAPTSTSDARPIVGIAFPEPIDDRTWSGVPAGLTRGLRACGIEVVHLVGTSVGGAATRSPEVAQRTSEEIERAVRAAGQLDGVVQMGSTFTLPPGLRYVTFEDVTVAQALTALDLPDAWARAWRQKQADAYERAVTCCVASAWAAGSVRQDYGVPAERIRVVGLGANLELAPRRWTGEESPRFLFVGKGWERKNGPAVLAAFDAVRCEFPTATLDLVSDHPPLDRPGVRGHGPLSPVADSAREASRRSFLRDLFERATCFVLPSRFEPYGIVYVEAGGAAVASIGTSVGGAADAIGEGGVLVDPGDGDALREAMLALCDPAVARRLGEAAKENADRHSWQAVATRVLEALGVR